MSKFDPPKSELRFRLWFSLAGLALLVFGLFYRSQEEWGIGAWEAVLTATLFFGGTVVWTLIKLRKSSDD